MAEQKGLGSKLIGLFVESDEKPEGLDGSGEKTAAELVAELAGQTAPAGQSAKRPTPGAPAASGAPAAPTRAPEPPLPNLKLDKIPAAGSGPLDFDAIFKEAGMDVAELDRVKKAEELLKGLPPETPVSVKKQIVEASLKAFGFEIEKIVLAAQNQKRALDAYVKVNESATAKAIQDAEVQIRSFNEKIAALRTDIEKRTAGLTSVTAAAQSRKTDVQKVLDFFQGAPVPGAPTP
jgi:hypothetical protein